MPPDRKRRKAKRNWVSEQWLKRYKLWNSVSYVLSNSDNVALIQHYWKMNLRPRALVASKFFFHVFFIKSFLIFVPAVFKKIKIKKREKHSGMPHYFPLHASVQRMNKKMTKNSPFRVIHYLHFATPVLNVAVNLLLRQIRNNF